MHYLNFLMSNESQTFTHNKLLNVHKIVNVHILFLHFISFSFLFSLNGSSLEKKQRYEIK